MEAVTQSDVWRPMAPISSTVIYSCAAGVLFLFGLLILWIIAQCCERNRPPVSRKQLLNNHLFVRRNQSMCEPLYGSTACISVRSEDEKASVSNGEDEDSYKTGLALPSLRYISASEPTSPVVQTKRRAAEKKCCKRCGSVISSSKYDRKSAIRQKGEMKRLGHKVSRCQSAAKRNSTNTDLNLRRSRSMYVDRPKSFAGENSYYKNFMLPVGELGIHDFRSQLNSYPRTQMIPRAKWDASSVLAFIQETKKQSDASRAETPPPNQSLCNNGQYDSGVPTPSVSFCGSFRLESARNNDGFQSNDHSSHSPFPLPPPDIFQLRP